MKVTIDTASPSFVKRLAAASSYVNNIPNPQVANEAGLTRHHCVIIDAMVMGRQLNVTMVLEMDDLATLLLVEHCIKVSSEPNDILDPIEDEAQENAG